MFRNRDHCLYPKDGVQQRCKLRMFDSELETILMSSRSMEILTMPKPMSNTCSMMWRSVKKLAANKIRRILISQLYEHWPFGASGCLLRIRLCSSGFKTGQITAGRKVNRKLTEISWQLSMPNKSISSWEVIMRQMVICDRLLSKHMSMIRNVKFKVTTSPSMAS